MLVGYCTSLNVGVCLFGTCTLCYVCACGPRLQKYCGHCFVPVPVSWTSCCSCGHWLHNCRQACVVQDVAILSERMHILCACLRLFRIPYRFKAKPVTGLHIVSLGSMLQFAVGFVITPSCRGGRSKPKMGCRPSQKQNNAKKQVPSP